MYEFLKVDTDKNKYEDRRKMLWDLSGDLYLVQSLDLLPAS